MKVKERVPVKCIDCGADTSVAWKTFYAHRHDPHYPWRCPECRNKYFSMKTKQYLDSLSEEQKREMRARLIETLKERNANLTEEDHAILSQRASKAQRKRWSKLSEEERKEQVKDLREGLERWKNNLTEEGWEEFGDKVKAGQAAMSEEDRERMLRNRGIGEKAAWAKVPEAERKEKMEILHEKCREWWNNKTPEERAMFLDKLHENAARWRDQLSPEEKAIRMRNLIKSAKSENSAFRRKFERSFVESHLSSSFYFKPEVKCTYENFYHHWDYGIYNTDDKLVMLVDLDGSFNHADEYDYDDKTSREDLDEKRALTVPEGVRHCIILYHNFAKSFEQMVKRLMMNYDEYVKETFRYLRAMPFPYPHHSDVELTRSFEYLDRFNPFERPKLYVNNRLGDFLITEFHHSIYHDHKNKELSPFQAWSDDGLLKKCIENRIIYQSYLNPNKILQGFNISKIAPKVSVFSAALAKMIIARYLNEYQEVFDPFSGYSGRLLGTISLGKKYIGQDLSERHVVESNNLLRFLRKYSISFDASVTCKNVLDSSGEYQCLFTCPPYGNKEQWEDVPVDTRSCDDWIDECLKRFKCKRYVFVVDETRKYVENIEDEISNRSHFGAKREYLIII